MFSQNSLLKSPGVQSSIEKITKSPNDNLLVPLQYQKTIFQNSPSFRSTGKGSKQVAKALEQSKEPLVKDQFYLYKGSRETPGCFVKDMRASEAQTGTLYVRPYRSSIHNSAYLVPWPGIQLWQAKKASLISVEVISLNYIDIEIHF